MHTDKVELWGGVECTINRVGDGYHSQLKRNGHLTRVSDIDRFADLGLSALRFPMLWELTCETPSAAPRFGVLEPLLQRTRERALRVIAGLCHHGSGPVGTSLLDPNFDRHLMSYARRVAEKFPWIEDYTPVNEPLTTARFSCLYGHWYPHVRDTPSFLRALVNECRATSRAMAAIREVQPRARLVQTEDIATIRSAPALAYQADYENQRRFLSLDLLSGRVDRYHPLYRHLVQEGISEAELAFFCNEPCAPNVIGVNYYFTSDRYLESDVSRHPEFPQGGNGKHVYRDVDAARAGIGIVGHRDTLQVLWDRYQTPLVVSEVHAGCTREEQLRWFAEAWRAANEARAKGIDVQAITAWSLLGSFDWNSLVTREEGVYESGVFDLRSIEPRATALARMVQTLSLHGDFDHPVLSSPGWWHRAAGAVSSSSSRPVLITGARGRLARGLAKACERRGLAHIVLSRSQLDIANAEQVEECLRALRPWAVLNAAGFAGVDDAEQAPQLCQRENCLGPTVLAAACAVAGAQLLTFSSDLVFDGALRRPYVESDRVGPLSTYGESQASAERAVLELAPEALVIRTSGLFDPWDDASAMTRTLRELACGRVAHVPCASVVSPTYLPHLVDVALDLLIDAESGVWHLANAGSTTWAEFVERAAARQRLSNGLLQPTTNSGAARRPLYSVLGSERAQLMPTLDDALDCYLRAHRERGAAVELAS